MVAFTVKSADVYAHELEIFTYVQTDVNLSKCKHGRKLFNLHLICNELKSLKRIVVTLIST